MFHILEVKMKISDKTKDIIEWLICILIAFILALLIRYYIGTPTIVKQRSMYPTLKQNQRLILNRWGRTTKQMPKRGDIITFEAPSDVLVTEDEFNNNVIARYDNEHTSWFGNFVYHVLEIGKQSYIKRVIGLPGDHIQIKDGKVYLNGEEFDEPYLQDGVTTSGTNNMQEYIFTDLVVPENCVFAMGDNRDYSTDCRAFGCIPLEKIEGTVWIRFWPLNLFGKVD